MQASSARRQFSFPLEPIRKAIVGATLWTDDSVVQDLTILFSGHEKKQNELITQWVENYNADWENIVMHQIARYS